MQRRELLATAASLTLVGSAGLSTATADAAAQTEPLRVEDATVDLGDVTVDLGSAALRHEGETMTFAGEEWSASTDDRTVALAGATVTVEGVDAETYADLRTAVTDAAEEGSLSPLLAGLAGADVDAESPVSFRAGPVATDEQVVVDEVTTNGTVGGVVPEGVRSLSADDGIEALGPATFEDASVRREDVEVTAEDVAVEPRAGELVVTAETGSATTETRSFDFEGATATFAPPAEGVERHASALAGLRRLAARGDLTVAAIGTTLVESGVTLDNTAAAVQNTRVEASVEQVTEDGETVVENVGTGGTVAELVALLQAQV